MKFAYLIMAHDNEEQLKLLIESLDYPENDIFLHIDKKSDIRNISFETKNAKIKIYSCFSVYWADLSQTKCQIFLLKEAIKEKHDYYHLISGHDFPIKSHEIIKKFFHDNYGKQFIHFESKDYCLKERCRYYHFLAPVITRCRIKLLKNIMVQIETYMLSIQKRKDVSRPLYCGANWFSITHDLAEEYILHSKEILRKVRWTLSSDEYVLQTFYRTMAEGNYEIYSETKDPYDYCCVTREIDWRRGSPYVWRNEDFDFLMSSERMFARKFDQRIDNIILNRIFKENERDRLSFNKE